MRKPETRLVWSDDPKDKARVERESAPEKIAEDRAELVASRDWTAVFRLEKGGRGGKTVTVIDQLPRHETFLRDLCKELKTKCGSGGTYLLDSKTSRVEIQGDQRDAIKAIFTKKGIRFKGM